MIIADIPIDDSRLSRVLTWEKKRKDFGEKLCANGIIWNRLSQLEWWVVMNLTHLRIKLLYVLIIN